MAKHDYVAMNEAAIAHVDESAGARTVTQGWLADPRNIETLLEVVAGGKSLRRFCEGTGLSYSAVQRALTGDALRDRYEDAQQQQAEHLLGEMERITAKLEGGDMDPKVGAVILDNLKWRISKYNQRRFGDRQVIEQHTFDHTKAHIEAVRALARHPRRGGVTYEGEVIRPRLSREAQPQATPGARPAPAPATMVAHDGRPSPIDVGTANR